MHQSETVDLPTTKLTDIYEMLSKIISFLPRTSFEHRPFQGFEGPRFDPSSDSNLMCSVVSKNLLIASRKFAFWNVRLRTEKEALRFLAALQSNEAYTERNPAWPLMNSTRTIAIGGYINGLFQLLISR
jgi:hypothetical protein